MNQPTTPASTPPTATTAGSLTALATRSAVGGTLMGLANLVPGISGGTMLLAAGVYTQFIEAISAVTSFRFHKRSLVTLLVVVAAAAAAILLFARPVHHLVVHHRWVMYCLFIGLTLGGVPVVWKLINRSTPAVVGGAIVGFCAMAALAMAQMGESGQSADRSGFVLMFLAGVAGASAMILPGISGGYLLLVLGVYVPILAAIAATKDALQAGDLALLRDPVLTVVLPVGLGVVVGVAAVSNLLRWCLRRLEKATLGVLLGLLLGSVVGLYPFQKPVEPTEGMIVKSQPIALTDGRWTYATTGRAVKLEDLPTRVFRPSVGQVGGALGLVLAGFAMTMGVAYFSPSGGEDKRA